MADPDFVGGGDQVLYEIDQLADGNYTIEVKLHYQPLAYNFVQDLLQDIDEPRVALFRDLNDGANIRYETISSVAEDIIF